MDLSIEQRDRHILLLKSLIQESRDARALSEQIRKEAEKVRLQSELAREESRKQRGIVVSYRLKRPSLAKPSASFTAVEPPQPAQKPTSCYNCSGVEVSNGKT